MDLETIPALPLNSPNVFFFCMRCYLEDPPPPPPHTVNPRIPEQLKSITSDVSKVGGVIEDRFIFESRR